MNTKRLSLNVAGIDVDVVRKNIKNLHLGVYPPTGKVRVAAPVRLSDEAVRLAVISRLGWIKRQQGKFAKQDRQSRRQYVSGESHYFQGHRYLLNVVDHVGPARVVVRNRKRIDLNVRKGRDTAHRERVFLAWYRAYLRRTIPSLIEKWAAVIKIEAPAWSVRYMKTRWGTCNVEERRICLNLELAKKPARCLEYILVHELVHLLERHHNERFTALMNTFLPQWRIYRDELNSYPLCHESWDY